MKNNFASFPFMGYFLESKYNENLSDYMCSGIKTNLENMMEIFTNYFEKSSLIRRKTRLE